MIAVLQKVNNVLAQRQQKKDDYHQFHYKADIINLCMHIYTDYIKITKTKKNPQTLSQLLGKYVQTSQLPLENHNLSQANFFLYAQKHQLMETSSIIYYLQFFIGPNNSPQQMILLFKNSDCVYVSTCYAVEHSMKFPLHQCARSSTLPCCLCFHRLFLLWRDRVPGSKTWWAG